MNTKGILIIISGPSGVGKTSVRNAVLAADAATLFSVSATTRSPRVGEKPGRDYYFISQAEFDRLKQNGEFLETATVFDHSYGTLKSEVDQRLQAGYNVILDVDTKGAEQIRAYDRSDAVSVFILPPSEEELRRRIINRHTEQGDDLRQRIERAQAETEQAVYYDYQVINDDIHRCAARIVDIIAASRKRLNEQGGAIC